MSTTLTRSESAPLLLHRRSRRKSSVSVASLSCQDLPHSLDALDLSLPSPIETLASLRIVLLSYLSHLEISLSELDCTLADLEHGLDDARQWARDGLDMLGEIRADVVSRLPDLALDHPPAIDQLVARLHELRDVAAHLPLLPGLDGVKARLSDLDIPHPADYIPSLSARLQSLHAHISELELELPWSFTPFHSFHPTQFLSDLCDRLAALDLLHAPVVEKTEEKISTAAREVAQAIQLSLQGSRLIAYENLPEEWRNNPFVTTGYRFIPLNRWHLLALSVFAFHNETLNIHTHLIPFLLWARSLLPSPTSLAPSPADTPLYIFTFFALLCLGTSALWHTMSGCAHRNGMVLSAKLDYVGIGWLISASVASVIWHGFVGVPSMQRFYVGACAVTGVAGSVLPFYDWFNTPRHKMTRVAFFVSLSLTALAPLTHLAILSSPSAVLELTTPIAPSLASYVAGLFFYVSNLPERALSPRWAEWVFWCGGGSHAIWHAFIVLAIRQHRVALGVLRDARPILEGVVSGV